MITAQNENSLNSLSSSLSLSLSLFSLLNRSFSLQADSVKVWQSTLSVSCLQTLLHKTADPVVVITRGEKCRMVFFCAKNYFVVLRQTRIGFKLEDRDPLRQMLLGSVVRTRAARATSLVRAAHALTLAARREGAASLPPSLFSSLPPSSSLHPHVFLVLQAHHARRSPHLSFGASLPGGSRSRECAHTHFCGRIHTLTHADTHTQLRARDLHIAAMHSMLGK